MEKNALYRRYVSVREITGYTLFDASRKFASIGYDSRFLYDVYRINLNYIQIVSVINGIWDVVNDTFTGILVDRTRTRWGKFRPYLGVSRIALVGMSIFKYLSPFFLPESVDAPSKFVVFLGMSLVSEAFNTFSGIAETGLFAAMSPSPDDRVLLKSRASQLSSIIDNLPGILTGLLMDMVNHKVLQFSLGTLFATFGSAMALISIGMVLYYILVSKERVAPSVELPNIRAGLTAIWRNKPMRVLLLADLAKVFMLDTGRDNYFIDVLGYTSLQTVLEVPNIPISLTSYAFIPFFRRNFSLRVRWVFIEHFERLLDILVFFFGISDGTGPNGRYTDWRRMLPALILRDTLFKFQLGLRYVTPVELLNEALDYCEWQDGTRAEGMILASKSLATKIVTNAFSWVSTTLLKKIGYTVGTAFGQQGARVKYLLFVSSFLLPGVTGLVSVIPKLFYHIDNETRTKMYTELNERRRLAMERENADTAEVLV